jgi:SAM-dependent methyltransferase
MSPPDTVTFPKSRLKVLAGLQQHHFWHSPRRVLIGKIINYYRPITSSRFVDVGCGNGSLVTHLRRIGINAFGIDPYAETVGLDPQIFRVGTTDRLPFSSESLPMVGLFDVLEHVDDNICLEEVSRVLIPGGLLFVSVPAIPWLWSERDVRAGHRRRYTRASLRIAIESAGLRVVDIFGYQALLLPLLVLSRLRPRQHASSTAAEDRPAPWLDRILSLSNWLEVRVYPCLRPPLGSSLMAVCQKP